MENKLVSWIKQELKARDWSIRELARRSKVSHAYLADVLRGDKDVNWYFCVVTANGLNEPVWKFFMMGGLLEDVPLEVSENEKTRLLIKIFNGLPPPAQDEALNYLNWLSIRHKEG